MSNDILLNLEDATTKMSKRPLVHITDQLWDLLKFSASYSDLKKALTFIFQFSTKSGIVNTPTNENRLAELIRGVANREIACPHLISTEPLELLFEIGVEKLMRDFEFVFKQSRLGNIKDLNIGGKNRADEKTAAGSRMSLRKTLAAINVNTGSSKTPRKTLLKTNTSANTDLNDEEVEFRNSRFTEKEADLSVAQLSRIYLTIEHVIAIQNNLPPESENFYVSIAKKICEKPLMSLDSLKEQKFDKFEYVLSNMKSNFVRNITPTAQRIILKSSNKMKNVCSVFMYDIEQIVPFLADENQHKNETDSYHMYSYNTISVRTK